MTPLARAAGSSSRVAADAVLACALAVLGELEVLASAGFPGSDAAAAIAVPAIALPLAWRRRAPLAAVSVTYGAYAAQALAGGRAEQSIAVSIALLVAIYSLALHAADGRVAVAALPACQGIAWMGLALEGGRGIGDYAFSLLLGGGAWLGGYAVRSGRLTATRLERRAAHVEAQSAEDRERAVAAERARIARDMHDVVAHGMSVIVVQAGAARSLLSTQPERSEQLLLSVESTGRQALAEMRRLLGLMRTDADGLGLVPQPGLAQLDELAGRAREAGLELTVERTGEPRELPPGVDLAAYRIVQEAVTNAIKHGGGSARVAIGHRPGGLEIDVRNPLGGGAGGEPGGGGHGLIGMRERAALYGGTLEAGRDGSGEFRVHARLPVERDEA